ncbi:ankyrin repeat domain-containing protein [Candidatus Bathyarchaeota archaeon]|nr:ankyrin repeat domain-containing protein [Candidatus Bathyarchaeota archaeon]
MRGGRKTARNLAVPWHQVHDYNRRDDSLAEFWTRYILDRPHQNEPWDYNLSILLKNVVDVVLEREGKPVDHSIRRRYVRVLFDEAIQHMVRGASARFDNAERHSRLSQTDWAGLHICAGNERQITRASFEAQVLHAQLILGQTKPYRQLLLDQAKPYQQPPESERDREVETVFGPASCAVIMSGSTDLARLFFQEDLPVPPRSYKRLACAVETQNLDMVKLVMETMETPGDPLELRRVPDYEAGVVRAIILGERHLARYMLSRAPGGSYEHVYLVHEGARAAAHHGDTETLRWLLAHARRWTGSGSHWILTCCTTVLEIACRAGRVDAVRLLLESGVNPRGKKEGPGYRGSWWYHPHEGSLEVRRGTYLWAEKSVGSMFWAAATGHVRIGEMLVAAGIQLEEYEWGIAALGAVELGKVEFLGWMIDGGHLPRWQGTEAGPPEGNHRSGRPDLVGHVCVWGTPEMLRMLVSKGYTLDGPLCAEGHRYDNIVLAAMNWLRPDMVEALLDLGAPQADPFQSARFKGLWESGEFPQRARTRILGGHKPPCRCHGLSHATFHS